MFWYLYNSKDLAASDSFLNNIEARHVANILVYSQESPISN